MTKKTFFIICFVQFSLKFIQLFFIFLLFYYEKKVKLKKTMIFESLNIKQFLLELHIKKSIFIDFFMLKIVSEDQKYHLLSHRDVQDMPGFIKKSNQNHFFKLFFDARSNLQSKNKFAAAENPSVKHCKLAFSYLRIKHFKI